MNNNVDTTGFELVCVIVEHGLGSKIMHTAKHNGISGGTILFGRGTIHNRILEFIGMADVRKEIVLMVAGKKTAQETIEKLDEKFKFHKPNHGIAFCTPVCDVMGAHNCKRDIENESRGADVTMYQAITIIVDKGKAERVIEVAEKAGSTGGTIINGRGSGIHETSKLFLMEIEPEKEIVIILSKRENTEAIVSAIREDLKIDEPGHGIIYVQNVIEAYGLYE